MSEIDVWLSPTGRDGDEVRIGRLYLHAGRGAGSASFRYDEGYLSEPWSYPIDPALPMTTGLFHTRAGQTLFGAFEDSCPDRWGRALIRRSRAEAAREEGHRLPEPTEGDYLLGVRDDLRQGALRLAPAMPTGGRGMVDFLAHPATGVPRLADLPELLLLAARAERDEAALPELRRLVGAGSSLGGARPKAHVMTASGRYAIAKFPSAVHDDWNVMAWEWVALELARLAGVDVPPASLIKAAGHDVLVVDRFDRVGQAGDASPRRLGYVSAMTVLEAADGDRATMLDLAEVVEQESRDTTRDLEQLWRRAVLACCINNTDNHLRNHGFLRDAGRPGRAATGWTLSPAFDLNPTPFAGEFATDVVDVGDGGDLEAVRAAAVFFRVPPAHAEEVVHQVQQVVRTWPQVASRAGIPTTEQRRMAAAFAAADGAP